MGANDLVWTADINADPFVNSTNRMRAEAKRVRESVDRDIKQMGGVMGGRSNKWSFMTQQFAYGIEDAASQFGTMGISGAVRGASNNLSAGLAALGPRLGLYGALASTVALVGVSMVDLSKADEEEKRAAERNAESQRNLIAEYKRRAEMESELAQMRTSEGAKRGIDSNKTRIEGIREELKEAQRQFDVQKNLIEQKKKIQQEAYDQLNYVGAYGAGPTQSDIDNFLATAKELREIQRQKVIAEHDLKRREAEMPAVAAREKADKEAKKVQDEQKKAQQEAEKYFDDTRTAAEKYAKELERINRLRERKLLDEETAKRAAQKAYETMQAELDKHKLKINIDHPGPYTDARSKEGLDNYYKALMTPYSVSRPEYKDKPPGLTAWEQSQRDAQKHQEDMVSRSGEIKRTEAELEATKKYMRDGTPHIAAYGDQPAYYRSDADGNHLPGPNPTMRMEAAAGASKFGDHAWMYGDGQMPNPGMENRDTKNNAAFNEWVQLEKKLITLTERLVKLQEQQGIKQAQPEPETVVTLNW